MSTESERPLNALVILWLRNANLAKFLGRWNKGLRVLTENFDNWAAGRALDLSGRYDVMAEGDRYGQSLLVDFIASLALMTEVLTITVDLDLFEIDDVKNSQIALMFFALVLLVVLYPLVLLLVYLMGFRSKEIEKRLD